MITLILPTDKLSLIELQYCNQVTQSGQARLIVGNSGVGLRGRWREGKKLTVGNKATGVGLPFDIGVSAPVEQC
jgi:hypothetical protein